MVSCLEAFPRLLTQLEAYFSSTSPEVYNDKISEATWSKKELVGHLIDSALHNLQRFTEIQFTPSPYVIRSYAQDELVKAHGYQNADIKELLNLLTALNTRITKVASELSDSQLDSLVQLPDGSLKDVTYLIEDYVAHFEHHLQQILS